MNTSGGGPATGAAWRWRAAPRSATVTPTIMVGPGLFRIPLGHTAVAFLKNGGPGGLFGLDLLLVYACIAWDTWRHRRLHPAFVCGALLIATEDLPFLGMFLSTPMWTRLATWLLR